MDTTKLNWYNTTSIAEVTVAGIGAPERAAYACMNMKRHTMNFSI
jgi:hypothetical protein